MTDKQEKDTAGKAGAVVQEPAGYLSASGVFATVTYYEGLVPSSRAKWTPLYTGEALPGLIAVASSHAQGFGSGHPIAYTSQDQLDRMAENPGGNFLMWGEPLPHHQDIPLYRHPFPPKPAV
jgi:hypothetical protein